MTIRIGTRGSDLALWQANWVAGQLGEDIEIVVIETSGDTILDVPLQTVEGSAFFTGEVDRALADGEVDLAVHSMKDMPVSIHDGLAVAAIPERADAGERLLVAPAALDADAQGCLPLVTGARVGTSSPRREAQLRALRPDLVCLPIRGNVPTRVDKLRRGDFDAILLAAAGLDRLDLDVSDLVAVDTDGVVPAPAQGALCVKARPGDSALRALCEARLHDADAAEAAHAERTVLLAAGGGCNLPVGAHARRSDDGGWSARICAWDETAQDSGATATEAVEAAWARVSRAGQTVALAGSGEGPSKVAERLEALGAEVVHERVLAFEDLEDGDEAPPGTVDWVCVTSRQAAARMALPAPATRVAAVGPSTAAALAERGIQVAFTGAGGGAADLARQLPLGHAGATVLFPCAERHRPDLPLILEEERGAHVVVQPLYRTVPASGAALSSGPVHARIWLSPSAVQAAGHLDDGAPAYCLGAATKTALEAAGIPATLGLPPANGDSK